MQKDTAMSFVKSSARIRNRNVQAHAGNVRANRIIAKTASVGGLTANDSLSTTSGNVGSINVVGVEDTTSTLDFNGSAADGGSGILNVDIAATPTLEQVLTEGNDANATDIDMNDNEFLNLTSTDIANCQDDPTNLNVTSPRIGYNVSNAWFGFGIGSGLTFSRDGNIIGHDSGNGGTNNTAYSDTLIGNGYNLGTKTGGCIGNTTQSITKLGFGYDVTAGGYQPGGCIGRRANGAFAGIAIGEDANTLPGPAIGKNAVQNAIGKDADGTSGLNIRLSATRDFQSDFSTSAPPSSGASGQFWEVTLNGTPYKIELDTP